MFYSRADPVGVKLVNLAKLLSPVIVVISCPIYFYESVKRRTTPGVYRISLEGSGTYDGSQEGESLWHKKAGLKVFSESGEGL